MIFELPYNTSYSIILWFHDSTILWYYEIVSFCVFVYLFVLFNKYKTFYLVAWNDKILEYTSDTFQWFWFQLKSSSAINRRSLRIHILISGAFNFCGDGKMPIQEKVEIVNRAHFSSGFWPALLYVIMIYPLFRTQYP